MRKDRKNCCEDNNNYIARTKGFETLVVSCKKCGHVLKEYLLKK